MSDDESPVPDSEELKIERQILKGLFESYCRERKKLDQCIPCYLIDKYEKKRIGNELLKEEKKKKYYDTIEERKEKTMDMRVKRREEVLRKKAEKFETYLRERELEREISIMDKTEKLGEILIPDEDDKIDDLFVAYGMGKKKNCNIKKIHNEIQEIQELAMPLKKEIKPKKVESKSDFNNPYERKLF